MDFVSIAESQSVLGKKFMRVVLQMVKSAKVTYKEIKWDINPVSAFYTT
jgi:hypothetical protein